MVAGVFVLSEASVAARFAAADRATILRFLIFFPFHADF